MNLLLERILGSTSIVARSSADDIDAKRTIREEVTVLQQLGTITDHQRNVILELLEGEISIATAKHIL